ncbi:MAG: membrane integrity-associated transporter subunit PqiC [Alphaproteobacteria bacterium]|nr:membrane integrity-associated transporter subunit PqiC [Alphaproteobacteria bacterium]
MATTWRGLAAASMLLLAGCSEAPPPHLYVLSATSDHGAGAQVADQSKKHVPVAAARGGGSLIGVVPVTVPDYLDRPEIVTRSSSNEITVTDSRRWAERLSTNATGILAENLAQMLGAERVVVLPARSEVDYEVALDLRRFEIDANGQALMIGRWSVIDAKNRKEVARGGLHRSEPVADSSYDAIAAAMSRNLAVASDDIAAAVLHGRGPGNRSQQQARAN